MGELRANRRNFAARVRVLVTAKNGRTYVIGRKGGYRVGTLLQGWEDEGDDPYDWISDTLDGMGYTVPAGSVASVTLVFS